MYIKGNKLFKLAYLHYCFKNIPLGYYSFKKCGMKLHNWMNFMCIKGSWNS